MSHISNQLSTWIDQQSHSIPYLSARYTLAVRNDQLYLNACTKQTIPREVALFKNAVDHINDSMSISYDGISNEKVVEFLRLMGLAHFQRSKSKETKPFIVRTSEQIEKSHDKVLCKAVRMLPQDLLFHISSFTSGKENSAIVLKNDDAARFCLRSQEYPTYTIANLFRKSELEFSTILNSVGLKELDFSGCHTLSNFRLSQICKINSLEKLDISYCSEVKWLPKNSSLQHLTVSGIKTILPVQTWRNLKTLTLHNCIHLRTLPKNLTVEKLILKKVPINNYSSLDTWANLRHLEIIDSPIFLNSFPEQLFVETLLLNFNQIVTLNPLKTWQNLKSLTIIKCGFMHELPNNLTVEEFTYNSHDNASLEYLRRWKKLKKLTILNCSKVENLPSNLSVQTLSLKNVKLVEDLTPIYDWKYLLNLELHSCRVGKLPLNFKVNNLIVSRTIFEKGYSALENWNLMKIAIDGLEIGKK